MGSVCTRLTVARHASTRTARTARTARASFGGGRANRRGNRAARDGDARHSSSPIKAQGRHANIVTAADVQRLAAAPFRDARGKRIPANARPYEPKQLGVPCKVLNVYDGDTVTLALFHRNVYTGELNVATKRCRLSGVDAPELRGQTEAERESAVRVRDALAELVTGKMWCGDLLGLDKFGRLLVDMQSWSKLDDPTWRAAVDASVQGRVPRPCLTVVDWLIHSFPGECVAYDGKSARVPFEHRVRCHRVGASTGGGGKRRRGSITSVTRSNNNDDGGGDGEAWEGERGVMRPPERASSRALGKDC